MPTLIDASVFGDLDSAAMGELRQWILKGHGVVVYATSGKYGDELRGQKMEKILAQIRRSRPTRLLRGQQIEVAEKQLTDTSIRLRHIGRPSEMLVAVVSDCVIEV